MRSYLNMPVTVALTSYDPLIQAFAIVDRRIGKRSLAKLDLSNCEHVLVKAFFELRDCMSRRRKVGSNYS
jgi:hypothetical protein